MRAVTEKDLCNDAVTGPTYFESAHQNSKIMELVLESLEEENMAGDLNDLGKWCFSAARC